MKPAISNKDVLQLLTVLKNSRDNNPQGSLESRREMFTKQAAAMAVLMKAGINGVNTTSGSTSIGPSIGTFLETALAIVIIVEAGVAVYMYRERIAKFFSSTFGSNAEQIINPTVNSFTEKIATLESTPLSTAKIPTVKVVATSTPPDFIPVVTANTNENNSVEDPGTGQVTSTPDPGGSNNGLHLGQTKQPSKQPKSTKEPKNNQGY